MTTDVLAYKRPRLQRPETLSSPPAATFFSIAQPLKRSQLSFIHQTIGDDIRNQIHQAATPRPQALRVAFDPDLEDESYPVRYGMPRPYSSLAARWARRSLSQALDPTQLARHQIGINLSTKTNMKSRIGAGRSTLSYLLRGHHHQQRYYKNDDDDDIDDDYDHHCSTATAHKGARIEKMRLDQENNILKKLSTSPLSALCSSPPPQHPRKDYSRQERQVDNINTRSSYYYNDDNNDDYDDDTKCNMSQRPSPIAEFWRRCSLGSATATNTNMAYGNGELQELAVDLEQHLNLSERPLDLDQIRRSSFHATYYNTTLANTHDAVKSLVFIGISSTASAYLLLLTYRIAEDLYIFIIIRGVLTLMHWVWISLVVWPFRSVLTTFKAAYYLLMSTVWPDNDAVAIGIHILLLYILRLLRRAMMELC